MTRVLLPVLAAAVAAFTACGGPVSDIERVPCTSDSSCGEGLGCRPVEGGAMACVRVETPPPSASDGGTTCMPAAGSPTYDKDVKAILDAQCIACHAPPNQAGSGRTDFNLGVYEDMGSVKGAGSFADRIVQRAVIVGDMPPGAPLPQSDKDTLKKWFDNCALKQ